MGKLFLAFASVALVIAFLSPEILSAPTPSPTPSLTTFDSSVLLGTTGGYGYYTFDFKNNVKTKYKLSADVFNVVKVSGQVCVQYSSRRYSGVFSIITDAYKDGKSVYHSQESFRADSQKTTCPAITKVDLPANTIADKVIVTVSTTAGRVPSQAELVGSFSLGGGNFYVGVNPVSASPESSPNPTPSKSPISTPPVKSPSPTPVASPLNLIGEPAKSARLNSPYDVTVDGQGNIYIADTFNHMIRKVDSKTGIMVTIAGTGAADFYGDKGDAKKAKMYKPSGISITQSGDFYIADTGNNRLRKIKLPPSDNLIQSPAPSPSQSPIKTPTPSSTPAKSPTPSPSHGVTSPTPVKTPTTTPTTPPKPGTSSIFAGTGTECKDPKSVCGDGGPATSAQFKYPMAVATDSSGNVYVGDANNNRVRKIDIKGIITTIVGQGPNWPGDNGPATSAGISSPQGIIVDKQGNIFISDTGSNRIRKIDTKGIITTIAGTGSTNGDYYGDGVPATSARFSYPMGVAVDSSDNIYIADNGNRRVRKLTLNSDKTTYTISTIAGDGNYCQDPKSACGDGGLATKAKLSLIRGVVVDSSGNVYVADRDNNKVRKLIPDGKGGYIISTIAGTGEACQNSYNTCNNVDVPTSVKLSLPEGIAIDSLNNIYIADTGMAVVRKIDAKTGKISTVAGRGYGMPVSSGTPVDSTSATEIELKLIYSIAVDNSGNLYIADRDDQRIRKVSP